MTTTAPQYVITLSPMPDPGGLDPVRRLARALKYALRACGLKCVDAREARPDAPQISGNAGAGTRCGEPRNTPATRRTGEPAPLAPPVDAPARPHTLRGKATPKPARRASGQRRGPSVDSGPTL